MKMNDVEKGECYRALLLLIGRDGIINSHERELLLGIGKKLDFARSFCESSIDDVLENRFIVGGPPRFSRPEFAQGLITDGLMIAQADGKLGAEEMEWLVSIAERNQLSREWVEEARAAMGQGGTPASITGKLAIEDFL